LDGSVIEDISEAVVTSLDSEIVVENTTEGVASQSLPSKIQISASLIENFNFYCPQAQATTMDDIQFTLDSDVDINSAVEKITKIDDVQITSDSDININSSAEKITQTEDLQLIFDANTDAKTDESFLIESNELNVQSGAVLILCSGEILKFILNEEIFTFYILFAVINEHVCSKSRKRTLTMEMLGCVRLEC
jgi:hypothetical protein